MRQRFRFTDDESRWLKQHLSDADVQSILQEPRTTAPNKRAAGLLTEKFRAHFSAPSTGETQAAWLKRYNNASRERRNDLVRHVPEDIVAFSARMQMLPKVCRGLAFYYAWLTRTLRTSTTGCARTGTRVDVLEGTMGVAVP